MFFSERLRLSTASVSVCESRATPQVMMVVWGIPFSSTVATTQVWPPSRYCTSFCGISTGGALVMSGAGSDRRALEPCAEDGTRLIALGAVELRGDEGEH